MSDPFGFERTHYVQRQDGYRMTKMEIEGWVQELCRKKDLESLMGFC